MSKQANSAKLICQRYGYPSEIQDLLEEICTIVQESTRGLRSILLSGSVATGDLVYCRSQHGFKIFSDLDLLVFAETSTTVGDLQKRLSTLEQRFYTNLFHIDLSINDMRALHRIAPSYQMAELRQVDSVLLGEDLRAYFPFRADPQISKQALILNLWKALLYWPDGDPSRQECFQWTLARLILDVPLLVFSELQHLLPGHQARAQAFCQLTPAQHPLATPLVQAAVARASAVRRAGGIAGIDLWPDFMATLDASLCHLGLGSSRVQIPAKLRLTRLRALLPKRSLRRLGGELRAALRGEGSLAAKSAWWLRRKETWAGVAVLEMLTALGSSADRSTLLCVESCLSHFQGKDFHFLCDELPVRQFRRAYWDGLTRLHPSLCQNTEFVQRAAGILLR